MNRRDLLRRGASLGAIALLPALSGCAETVGHDAVEPAADHPPISGLKPELPVEERSTTLESGIETGRDAEIESVNDLEAELNDRGIEIVSITSENRLVSLEHVLDEARAREHGVFEDVGTVSGGYAALVRGTDEYDALDATVLDTEEDELGSYYVATEWASELAEGGLGVTGYGEKIAGTIETG